MHQQIQFCTARDGARLAWARHGSGPPLVKAANWLTHLEYDWESPVWRYWLDGLGQSHCVVRYDERGCGLSDKDVGEPSIEQWVSDLETVVDAGAIERSSTWRPHERSSSPPWSRPSPRGRHLPRPGGRRTLCVRDGARRRARGDHSR